MGGVSAVGRLFVCNVLLCYYLRSRGVWRRSGEVNVSRLAERVVLFGEVMGCNYLIRVIKAIRVMTVEMYCWGTGEENAAIKRFTGHFN